MKKAAMLVAGGTGTRMGVNIPKQFLRIQNIPIIIHTLNSFWAYDNQLIIVVVLHSSCTDLWAEIANEFLSESQKQRILTTIGGAERTNSIYNGLIALKSQVADSKEYIIAIHDAVRPFVSKEILANTFEMAEKYEAAIPVVAIKSSLRKKYPTNQTEGFESSYAVNRSEYVEVQTPQTFNFEQLFAAYQHRKHDAYTDDASLYESETGKKVVDVEGSYYNLKITTPEDLFVAENIYQKFKDNR